MPDEMTVQAGAQAGAPADAQARALLALWNGVAPEQAEAYEGWHAHEHVPERCSVPGILWGRRFGLQTPASAATASPLPRYLTLYGLRDPQVLDSEPYQRLLREPTPMSRRMRPALRQVSRWVCTLHENTADPQAQWLAVWACAAPPGREPLAQRSLANLSGGAHGHLLAERIPDAAPLPWLNTDQGRGVEGHWLWCTAFSDSAALTAIDSSAAVFVRLPVGGT
jgi:hypothetical protein